MAITDRGKVISTADGYKALEKINNDVKLFKYMTQAEYDALRVKDKSTMYFIVGA